MNAELLDPIPLWFFFLLTFAISMLTVEAGYRIGRWRHEHASEEKDTSVAAMVASILGLLAFMLAFTFSLAASRFDARRQAVLEEANAIGTTYLRTRLLPEPERSEIAKLLRDYTELRVTKVNTHELDELLIQSDELQRRLWSHAAVAAEKDPSSIMTGLFVQSLNETIDLHSKRIFFGLRSRIPLIIWLTLFSLNLLSMASIGYQAGQSATRRSLEFPILPLAFASVLLLNLDLDRGQEGFLQVSQQAMIDLLKTMQGATYP